MLRTGWINLHSEIVKQAGKKATNHKNTRKQASVKWQGKMQNHDQGSRLIKKQKQVLSRYYQVSRIVIPFLSNFCSRWGPALLNLSSAYLFQASQPKWIFHWSVNMIQSVNLNHTHLTNKLWAFRKGYFCSQKKKKRISFINWVWINKSWLGKKEPWSYTISVIVIPSEFFWTYWCICLLCTWVELIGSHYDFRCCQKMF